MILLDYSHIILLFFEAYRKHIKNSKNVQYNLNYKKIITTVHKKYIFNIFTKKIYKIYTIHIISKKFFEKEI